jgi:hypothetical protein
VHQLREATGRPPLPSEQVTAASDAAKFVRGLAAWAGLRAQVGVDEAGTGSDDLEVRLLRVPSQEVSKDTGPMLLIAINRGAAGTFEISGLSGVRTARDLLRNTDIPTHFGPLRDAEARDLNLGPRGGMTFSLSLDHSGAAVLLLR